MRIETPRLTLQPFDRDEWMAIAAGERAGRTWAPDYPTDGEVLLASLGLLGQATQPTDDEPWGPLQVRERESGVAVGGVGFKGPPDVDGCVEVGYGFAPSARGRGYATEAVRAMCECAITSGATAVIAETHVGNSASERVLERCGFAITSRTDEMTYWRWEPASR